MHPEQLRSTDAGPYRISGTTAPAAPVPPDQQPAPKPYGILILRAGMQFWRFGDAAGVVAEHERLNREHAPHLVFRWLPAGERDAQGEWEPVEDLETITQ